MDDCLFPALQALSRIYTSLLSIEAKGSLFLTLRVLRRRSVIFDSHSCQSWSSKTVPSCCHHLLPRCYQNRKTQAHLYPSQELPGLWFLVGLGCLRLDSLNFVNRRSRIRLRRQLLEFQSGAAASTMVGFPRLHHFSNTLDL